MKHLLKTLVCAILPFALSACSGFPNSGGNNSSSSYEVVSQAEAANFAQQISTGEYFNYVQTQYKFKLIQQAGSNPDERGPVSFDAFYTKSGSYWSETGSEGHYYNYKNQCIGVLNAAFVFNTAKINYPQNSNTRYYIDKNANKLKIERVERDSSYTNQIRLEFDSSLYLRTFLLKEKNSNGYESSIQAKFNYGYDDGYEKSWMNYPFNIYTDESIILQANIENYVEFYYDNEFYGSGPLDFDFFFNEGVLSSYDVSNASYGHNGNCLVIHPYDGNTSLRIRITLTNGQQFTFRFQVSEPMNIGGEWLSFADAFNRGKTNSEEIYRYYGYISRFDDYKTSPTEWGSFYVSDGNGTELHVAASSFTDIYSWIRYDGGKYYYDSVPYFGDTVIDEQYGIQVYSRDLMIGDYLDFFYALNGSEVSFMSICGWNLMDRMENISISGLSLDQAFEHRASSGDGLFIYKDVRMNVTGYYGSYSNPSKYGRFTVADQMTGNTYTIMGSCMYDELRHRATMNQSTGVLSFNNPGDFLDRGNVVYDDGRGNIVYDRDISAGDVLQMDIIIKNGYIYGSIKSVDCSARFVQPEPDMREMDLYSLSTCYESDYSRKYRTYGYISSFTTYGMRVKMNPEDSNEYTITNASLNSSSIQYNSSSSIYQFNDRNYFRDNHGDLKIGDYVTLVVIGRLLNSATSARFYGYVESYQSTGECYELGSSTDGEIKLTAGSQYQISFYCEPIAARMRAQFISSDTSVVTVSANGLVTANNNPGASATVTLTVDNKMLSWIFTIENVEAQYITSSTANINIGIGGIYQIDYQVYPSGAGINFYGFSSLNNSVATVDSQSGMVTGIAPGTTGIRLWVDNASFEWTITVSQPCQSISSDYSEVSILIGERFQLSYNVYPADITSPIYFNTNDAAIVSVDENGILTGISAGQTSVYITIDGVFCYWTVTVSGEPGVEYAQYINSSYSEYTLNVGDMRQLDFEVIPSERGAYANFSSDNPAVVSIDQSGLMTAMAPGSTTITMNVDHVFHTWSVTVIEPQCEYINSNVTQYNLDVGQQQWLNFEVYPSSSGSRATFGSSNENVVTVDSNGLMTAIAPGTATVSMYVDAISHSWEIVVNDTCQGIVSHATDDTIYLLVNTSSSDDLTKYFDTVPFSGSKDRATYSSSNPEVVSIDENGIMTPLSAGETQITATVDGVSYTWTVIARNPVSPCTEINSSTDFLSMVYGETLTLNFSCEPSDARDRAEFTSSDSTVVTVDSNGNVTAVGPGQATITVTIDSISYTWSVNVAPNISSSEPGEIGINIGESHQLQFTYEPSNADVYFQSSDESIVTIDQNGVITGVSAGTTTVSVIIGGFSYNWTVTVNS